MIRLEDLKDPPEMYDCDQCNNQAGRCYHCQPMEIEYCVECDRLSILDGRCYFCQTPQLRKKKYNSKLARKLKRYTFFKTIEKLHGKISVQDFWRLYRRFERHLDDTYIKYGHQKYIHYKKLIREMFDELNIPHTLTNSAS